MPAELSYEFVSDVTIQDDSPIPAQQPFTKTWRVRNTGTKAWENDVVLDHVDGPSMTPNTRVSVPACAPGQEVNISVDMTAPDQLGVHTTNWRLRDTHTGNLFGPPLYTRIKVIAAPVQAGEGTNDYAFVDDVTIPDDMKVKAGAHFTKTWRIKNTGSLAWGPGYTLEFIDGQAMTDTTTVPLPACNPGDTVDISIPMTAGSTSGRVHGDWRVLDPNGNQFGLLLWVQINVQGGTRPSTEGTHPEIKTLAPHFSQRDPRWQATRLGQGGSQTIGSWGCQLTSFAMVARALGCDTDPDRLNAAMSRLGGFVDGNKTRWDALQVVFRNIRFDCKLDADPNIINRVDASLLAGVPVPIKVDLTPKTRYFLNDQHWVVIVGRNGPSDFWINDPSDVEDGPRSLMDRYGAPDGTLHSSILSAIFYRAA